MAEFLRRFRPFLLYAGLFALQVGIAPLYTALSAISPPRLRPLMFSLLGLMVAVMGGIAGGVLVGAIAEATDIRWGLAALAPTGIVGGFLMARGATTIDDDIARLGITVPPAGLRKFLRRAG